MKTFHDFLKELNQNLKIDLDKNLILTPQKKFNYHSILQRCNHSVEMLKHFGVEKSSLVPVLLENSPDFIIAVISLWMLEAIPVPINIKLSSSEIKAQLDFLKSEKIIVNTSTKSFIENSHLQQINFETLKHFTDEVDLDFTFDKNQTAIFLFTSGSSGKPKAVELTFSSLINSAIIQNSYIQHSVHDRWLASLPFYHIGGFSIIFRALMFGTQIIIPNNLKIHSIIQSMNQFKPTLISFVSSQMSEILKNSMQPFPELRYVLLGGGAINSNLMKEAFSKGWDVSKVYGSTETSSFVTILSPEEFKLKPDSAGKPIPPNEVFIVDENGKEMQANTEGEIVVKSPAVMKGYLHDEAATKQKLKNDLYFAGDIGFKDEDGYLFVVNRRSDLIVTGGENVNPIEVENLILGFPKVKEVCVFGIDDEKWGQKVAAAIVQMPDQTFEADELKSFLRDKTAAFKIPKEIFFVDELPKTELGKIKRGTVRENLK
ncbi:MAG: o-succinylbenzoate--CoA ligase [Ignavibacteriaceae bacterium]|nr:o-succinylbenzoate--CoA ligase [Ignavibacteriaceae bacterium]